MGRVKGKEFISLTATSELIKKLKESVSLIPGMTMTAFTEMAIEDALNVVAKEGYDGFLARYKPRRAGRPLLVKK